MQEQARLSAIKYARVVNVSRLLCLHPFNYILVNCSTMVKCGTRQGLVLYHVCKFSQVTTEQCGFSMGFMTIIA